jgi:hypothetical protein
MLLRHRIHNYFMLKTIKKETMRNLNTEEQNLVEELKLRANKKNVNLVEPEKVEYVEYGNFTFALAKKGKKVFIGAAKRNPSDTSLPEIGRNIALSRALRSNKAVIL